MLRSKSIPPRIHHQHFHRYDSSDGDASFLFSDWHARFWGTTTCAALSRWSAHGGAESTHQLVVGTEEGPITHIRRGESIDHSTGRRKTRRTENDTHETDHESVIASVNESSWSARRRRRRRGWRGTRGVTNEKDFCP